MNQHQQEAMRYHKASMQRVKDTAPPERQKFKPGARVKIAENLGHHMSHFPSGTEATVHHTYAHAYQRKDERSLRQYCLDVDGHGLVSWYNEDQLAVPKV